MQVEINKRYTVHGEVSDLPDAPLCWSLEGIDAQIFLYKCYPTWKDLNNAVVIVLSVDCNLCLVKSIDHDFEFHINKNFLVPLDKTCTCDLLMLMSKGCQCGGA